MAEDKQAIKIEIAKRTYPLKINAQDEEVVRLAVRRINMSVERYCRAYKDRDIQDALSMSILQFVIKLIELEKDQQGNNAIAELESLDSLLSQYLQEN